MKTFHGYRVRGPGGTIGKSQCLVIVREDGSPSWSLSPRFDLGHF
jgi:hypothetical protein